MRPRSHHDLAALLQRKAESDLEAVRVLADARQADDVIGFHAQQAIEKSLKAVLASRQATFPPSHDLAALAGLVTNLGIDLPATLDELDEFTPWAVEFRYGTTLEEGLDTTRAAEVAERAVRWAARMLE